MAVIPGYEGDFAVLPDHGLLCAQLRPGVVTITTDLGALQHVFVAGGFANVRPRECTLLVEAPILVSDLDISVIEDKLKVLASSEHKDQQTDVELQMKILHAQHAAVAKNSAAR